MAEQPRAELRPSIQGVHEFGNRPALTGFRALLIGCILGLSKLQLHDHARHVGGARGVLRPQWFPDHRDVGHRAPEDRRHQVGCGSTLGGSRPPAATPLHHRGFADSLRQFRKDLQRRQPPLGRRGWSGVLLRRRDRSALGHGSPFGFLSQCWSVGAVKEQFYLVWAMLLFVALKCGSRKTSLRHRHYWLRVVHQRPTVDRSPRAGLE